MNEYPKCPKCGRNKFRIIRGLCNSCYSAFCQSDSFVKKLPPIEEIILTDLQKEFINGCLLGDGWLSNLKYGRKNTCFGIDRKLDDLGYLKWQFEFLKNLCSRDIVIRDRYNKTTKKTHHHCGFETRYAPTLLEFRKIWYPNDIKIIPNNLELTDLIMKIWYCDDGSLDIYSPSSFSIKFSTQGFLKDEVLFLIDLLKNKYNENFSIIKDQKYKEQYCIFANKKAAHTILLSMKNDFPPGIERKLDLKKIIL